MAVVNPIQVGDEVKLRELKGSPIAVVTLNDPDVLCCIAKTGRTYDTSIEAAKPIKTGRKFPEVARMLKSMQM